jgi:RNA polymerase sigma factor for flagellar operon FliA
LIESFVSSATSPASDPERDFLSSLPLVDRTIAIQARRHGLSAADAEDFGAWAKARLIGDDYAVFRKFGGRSSLATYLAVVLANLFRDYRNSRWGRWRPSVAAKRLGPTAIRLEELLHRDGHSMREAVEVLRSAGVALAERELVRLAACLPQRVPAAEVSLDALPQGAPDLVAPPRPAAWDEEVVRAVERTLRALVDELPPEDGLILRMHYWDDVSVADVARLLRLEQKPLYRRLAALETRLRAALEARGIDRGLASEILGGDVAW